MLADVSQVSCNSTVPTALPVIYSGVGYQGITKGSLLSITQ
jgi:hypothetical protein